MCIMISSKTISIPWAWNYFFRINGTLDVVRENLLDEMNMSSLLAFESKSAVARVMREALWIPLVTIRITDEHTLHLYRDLESFVVISFHAESLLDFLGCENKEAKRFLKQEFYNATTSLLYLVLKIFLSVNFIFKRRPIEEGKWR